MKQRAMHAKQPGIKQNLNVLEKVYIRVKKKLSKKFPVDKTLRSDPFQPILQDFDSFSLHPFSSVKDSAKEDKVSPKKWCIAISLSVDMNLYPWTAIG